MKTNQEIQDMKKDCAKAIGEVTAGSEDVYKGWIEALNWVTMTNEQPDPNDDVGVQAHNENTLPDGLQKYIDGVGRNILYSNYHKSTNGIWSRAEVLDCGTYIEEDDSVSIEEEVEYWEVGVYFGRGDVDGSEEHNQTIYVLKKAPKGIIDRLGEWNFQYSNPEFYEEDHADKDDRLYHEEQAHIAMEKAKENK